MFDTMDCTQPERVAPRIAKQTAPIQCANGSSLSTLCFKIVPDWSLQVLLEFVCHTRHTLKHVGFGLFDSEKPDKNQKLPCFWKSRKGKESCSYSSQQSSTLNEDIVNGVVMTLLVSVSDMLKKSLRLSPSEDERRTRTSPSIFFGILFCKCPRFCFKRGGRSRFDEAFAVDEFKTGLTKASVKDAQQTTNQKISKTKRIIMLSSPFAVVSTMRTPVSSPQVQANGAMPTAEM